MWSALYFPQEVRIIKQDKILHQSSTRSKIRQSTIAVCALDHGCMFRVVSIFDKQKVEDRRKHTVYSIFTQYVL